MANRYEVRLWKCVMGIRLGREIITVTATDDRQALRLAPRGAARAFQPGPDVTYLAIDAELIEARA